MKKLLLGTVLALASTSAFAETCRVTDPTGTPLISVPRPMAKSLAKPKTVQLIYYTDYQNDKKKGVLGSCRLIPKVTNTSVGYIVNL